MSHAWRCCASALILFTTLRLSCIDLVHKQSVNVLFYYKQARPSSGTGVYPHMPILSPHAARFHERRISGVTFTLALLYGNVYIPVGVARALADSCDFGILGEKFTKMGDSLPWTPMNRRAKFDDASVILGGEIHNRTSTQKKQTIADISTPCLSAYVDNKRVNESDSISNLVYINAVFTDQFSGPFKTIGPLCVCLDNNVRTEWHLS